MGLTRARPRRRRISPRFDETRQSALALPRRSLLPVDGTGDGRSEPEIPATSQRPDRWTAKASGAPSGWHIAGERDPLIPSDGRSRTPSEPRRADIKVSWSANIGVPVPGSANRSFVSGSSAGSRYACSRCVRPPEGMTAAAARSSSAWRRRPCASTVAACGRRRRWGRWWTCGRGRGWPAAVHWGSWRKHVESSQDER